jgi:hypothetical protein
MDKYKWYASRSSMMNQLALGSSGFNFFSPKKSFATTTFGMFQNLKGINSVLLVYLELDTRSNPYMNFHRIYFSIDGNMHEIKDLNPSIDGDPFYIVSLSTGKRVNDNLHISAMDFILINIVQHDRMNIVSQTRQGKSVAIVQIDFNERLISSDQVTQMLRKLFDICFIDHLGQMTY